MRRDLASIFTTVLAAFTASCVGQPDYNCSPQTQPPTVTSVSLAMVQCVADREEPEFSVPVPRDLPMPTASATATSAVAVEYDPMTCDIDCARTCGADSGWAGSGSTHCGRDASGTVTCTTHYPTHYCGRSTEGAPTVADHRWSTVFALESISAVAFARLATELARFGAPEGLVERARTASLEEERHAELAASFAPRSLHLEPPRVRDVGARSLLDIALENAREGCVRETWGAFVAADRGDPPADDFEAFARAVAEDERGHAAWSWELDAWARTVLDKDAVAALDAVHQTERDALVDALPLERKSEATLLFALLRADPSSTFAS